MTTEIIHGAPGSYKTSSLVSLYLQPALVQNRTIITNIRGFASIDKLNDVYDLDSHSEIIVVPHDEQGFEQMARFYQWAPKHAFILMDEGQRVYPSRLTKLACFDLQQHDDPEWPKSVEEAFDKHRHFGWDIYISTTNIAKIHKEIRQVAEFGYRHKNMAGLVPFMKGRYKRVQHDPENNGKSLSYVLSSKICKIDKRAFNCYESTTTGKTKDIETKSALLGSGKVIFYSFLAVFALLFLVAYFATHDNPYSISANTPKNPVPAVDTPSAVVSSRRVSVSDDNNRLALQDVALNLMNSISYYSGSTLYKNGTTYQLVNYFFSDQLGQLSSYQLKYFGIAFQPISNMYLLSYGDVVRLIPVGNPHPDYWHPDDNSSQQHDNNAIGGSEALAAAPADSVQ
jgi:zona occludens toxin (predicted ATPase)